MMTSAKNTLDPKHNRILSALSASDFARIESNLEWVDLPIGHILYKPLDSLDYIYFPTAGIISKVFNAKDGSSTELGMTGKDGFVGVPLVLGGEQSIYKAVVQSKGEGYRLRADVFSWELLQAEGLLQPCLIYIQALMTQIAQNVVCNRHHKADQQLCRWLLQCLDLLDSDIIDMTHEQIANMLGVRRECVTGAAVKLQAAGLISYSRGHIVIIDKAGIQKRSCECYQLVKSENDRLFSLKPPPRQKQRELTTPATLRQRAETRLQEQPRPAIIPEWDSSRIIHELQVHQIELEMNNEELRRAYDETDALRAHYLDIYDFAPVPYLTVNSIGSILDMNLAAAILTRIKRSQKSHHRFHSLLTELSLPIFQNFLDEILQGKLVNSCEVSLKPNAQAPETLIKIEGVSDESGEECRINISKV
jgi:CRP-like cAMP-binding protein